MVQPGFVLQPLFLIGSGVLSVTGDENNKEIELLRLAPAIISEK